MKQSSRAPGTSSEIAAAYAGSTVIDKPPPGLVLPGVPDTDVEHVTPSVEACKQQPRLRRRFSAGAPRL